MNQNLQSLIAKAVAPNWFERAIALVSPTTAARRMKARAAFAFGGYIGARWDRKGTKNWFTTMADADGVTLGDLPALRERSRDLVRNTPIATGAIGTVVQNVVGGGLHLQARPDAEALGITDDQATELATLIEREFALWGESKDCDVTRTQDFYGLQELAFRAALEGGDAFAVLPMITVKSSVYATCIQLIEAERIANNGAELDSDTLKAGVEVDKYGAPVAYHIRRKHPGSIFAISDRTSDRVKAFGEKTGRRNVLHLFKRDRPGQTRGVPYLSPVIEPLKMIDRYTEAEVTAAVVSAMFTVFITTPEGEGFGADVGDTSTPPGNSAATSEVKLGTGSIVDLMPGEKPEFANPTRPNGQFDPFVTAILRQIGMALGIPFEVLVKHYTASYSAARAAILEAWTFFRTRREWLVSVFCQPAFETWFEEAVAIGRIEAPGFFADPAIRRAYLTAEWIGSAPQQIDPEKEVNAAKTRLDIGVSSLADETLSLTGKIWTDQQKQRVRERDTLKRDGMLPPPPPDPNQPPSAPGSKPGNNPNDPNSTPPDQPQGPDKNASEHLRVIEALAQRPINIESQPLNLHLTVEAKPTPVIRTGRSERDADGNLHFVIEEKES
jgi:lambda family phage portal protein